MSRENMITLNNGAYTKEIIFTFKTFTLSLAVRSFRYLLSWYKGELDPELEYNKRVTSYKKRGKFMQRIRKQFRCPLFIISWTRIREYDRRKVYVYLHHERYLKRKSFLTKLKNEFRFYLKKAGIRKRRLRK